MGMLHVEKSECRPSFDTDQGTLLKKLRGTDQGMSLKTLRGTYFIQSVRPADDSTPFQETYIAGWGEHENSSNAGYRL